MSKYVPVTEQWLIDNGYDGLVQPGECGCRISDGIRACGLEPQDEYEDCLPAHEIQCHRCGNGNCMPPDEEDAGWCMKVGPKDQG
jgi:hypothetical protein